MHQIQRALLSLTLSYAQNPPALFLINEPPPFFTQAYPIHSQRPSNLIHELLYPSATPSPVNSYFIQAQDYPSALADQHQLDTDRMQSSEEHRPFAWLVISPGDGFQSDYKVRT